MARIFLVLMCGMLGADLGYSYAYAKRGKVAFDEVTTAYQGLEIKARMGRLHVTDFSPQFQISEGVVEGPGTRFAAWVGQRGPSTFVKLPYVLALPLDADPGLVASLGPPVLEFPTGK